MNSQPDTVRMLHKWNTHKTATKHAPAALASKTPADPGGPTMVVKMAWDAESSGAEQRGNEGRVGKLAQQQVCLAAAVPAKSEPLSQT